MPQTKSNLQHSRHKLYLCCGSRRIEAKAGFWGRKKSLRSQVRGRKKFFNFRKSSCGNNFHSGRTIVNDIKTRTELFLWLWLACWFFIMDGWGEGRRKPWTKLFSTLFFATREPNFVSERGVRFLNLLDSNSLWRQREMRGFRRIARALMLGRRRFALKSTLNS